MTSISRSGKFKSFLAHEYDNSVLLVRKFVNVKANFSTYMPIAICLVLTFAICVLCRKLFGIVAYNERVSRIMLDTLGAFVSTNPNVRVRNRPERILHFFLIVFSMLFSMFASAILLGNILSKETQTGMNSLSELIESKLPICITQELNETRSEWSQNLE